MAVEEDGEAAEPEEWRRGGHLVEHHHAALRLGQQQHERAPQRTECGAHNVQAAAERARQPVAGDAHGERAVARLREAAARVVVRGVQHHRVPAVLKRHRSVHDQSLSAADAQIGVEEGDAHPGAAKGPASHPAACTQQEEQQQRHAQQKCERHGCVATRLAGAALTADTDKPDYVDPECPHTLPYTHFWM